MLWIIDVDGTLSVPNPRRLALLNGADHNCLADAPSDLVREFMKADAVLEDEPTTWCASLISKTAASDRVFLTARWEELRPATVCWLARHGWNQAAGYMRPGTLSHLKSSEFKLAALSAIVSGVRSFSVIDDDVGFLKLTQETFPRARTIYAPKWSELHL